MKYAVSFISFYENELKTEIVESNGVMEALNDGMRQANFLGDDGLTGFENCDNLEDAKQLAFNADMAVNVVEVK